jgi:cobalt/nickel transport system permease protein
MPILATVRPLVPAGPPAPPGLHAPDGFLTPAIAGLLWLATLVVLALAVRRTDRNLRPQAILLMAVMAAFVFAAQMFNFQVVGGTSGHLLGGVLVAILVGPWAGTLVMACVVGVQALFFLDGGLVVMGANIFNMGVVGTLGGYALYRALTSLPGGESRWRLPAAAIAAWFAVVAGSISMALQLAASGTTELGLALPAMAGVHALIGLGEAAITVGALAFVAVTRPDLLLVRDASFVSDRAGSTPSRLGRLWPVAGVAIAALVVAILAPLASSDPDGLERVAEDAGFLDRAQNAAYHLLTDYVVPGLEGNASTIVAGLIGIAIVVPIMLGVGRLLARPRA